MSEDKSAKSSKSDSDYQPNDQISSIMEKYGLQNDSNMTLGDLVNKKGLKQNYTFSSSESSDHEEVQGEIEKLQNDLLEDTEKTEFDFQNLEPLEESHENEQPAIEKEMSYIEKLRMKIQENTKKVNQTLKKEESDSEKSEKSIDLTKYRQTLKKDESDSEEKPEKPLDFAKYRQTIKMDDSDSDEKPEEPIDFSKYRQTLKKDDSDSNEKSDSDEKSQKSLDFHHKDNKSDDGSLSQSDLVVSHNQEDREEMTFLPENQHLEKLVQMKNNFLSSQTESKNLTYSKMEQSFALTQSQMTVQPQPQSKTLKNILLRSIFLKIVIKCKMTSFNKLKENVQSCKVKNAVGLIEKMSNLSRGYIVANSLAKIILKNQQKRVARSFRKMSQKTSGGADEEFYVSQMNEMKREHSQKEQSLTQEISYLSAQLKNKIEDLTKMEGMFKEYASWRSKLEIIEQKMKQEVDYWKTTTEKMTQENEKLQKDLLKVTKEQMQKAREIAEKDETIERLQSQIKQSGLETVEEVLCPQCKNSMEESIVVVKKDMISQAAEQKIADLTQMVQLLNKQIVNFKERLTFLETVESEQKKELEEHIDVLLKMEQERLILIKENQSLKQEKTELGQQSKNYEEKMELFEVHLGSLKDEIASSQKNYKAMIEEKDKQIAEMQIQMKKRPMVSSQKSMTGLPTSVLKQKQTNSTLKFKKPSVSGAPPEIDSTMSTERSSKPESSRELFELKKLLETNKLALEKVRKERDDFWTILNSDKYRNFKSVEDQKIKFQQQLKNVQNKLSEKEEECKQLIFKNEFIQNQLEKSNEKIEKLQHEYSSQKSLFDTLSQKNDRLISQIEKSDDIQRQSNELLEELQNENQKLKKDVTWLANSAKNNKIQSQKAIEDLEQYTQILKMMEQKLKQTEMKRDQKIQECMDLQNCLNQVMNQMPPVHKKQQMQNDGVPQPHPYPQTYSQKQEFK